MKCKNKDFSVDGFIYNDKLRAVKKQRFNVIITNDEKGKTISVCTDTIQFCLPADSFAKYLN